jgi:hypothetical protein
VGDGMAGWQANLNTEGCTSRLSPFFFLMSLTENAKHSQNDRFALELFLLRHVYQLKIPKREAVSTYFCTYAQVIKASPYVSRHRYIVTRHKGTRGTTQLTVTPAAYFVVPPFLSKGHVPPETY